MGFEPTTSTSTEMRQSCPIYLQTPISPTGRYFTRFLIFYCSTVTYWWLTSIAIPSGESKTAGPGRFCPILCGSLMGFDPTTSTSTVKASTNHCVFLRLLCPMHKFVATFIYVGMYHFVIHDYPRSVFIAFRFPMV